MNVLQPNKINLLIKRLIRDLNQWSLLSLTVGSLVLIPIASIGLSLLGGVGEMWSHVAEHLLPDYIFNSVILLLGTGLLCLFIGTASAWAVCNYNFRFRALFEILLFLPLALPSYITAYAYVGVFDNSGSLQQLFAGLGLSFPKIDFMNPLGLIWVLSISLFPYVYISARSVFLRQSSAIRETAYLLGASRKKYFFKVAYPLAKPAIFGGLFLVLMEVLNDYGAAKYYGVNTFTTGIFRTWTALEDLKTATYLAAILVGLILILLFLEKQQRSGKSFAPNDSLSNPKRLKVSGAKKWLIITIVSLPVFFGVILPVSQLLYWLSLTFSDVADTKMIWILVQSVGVALLTALGALIFALALIYFTRWNHLRFVHQFSKIVPIGYIIPGAIIGIGMMSMSQTLIDFVYQSSGLKIGWLLYGSSFFLIYAYIVRFFAVAYNPLEANSIRIGKRLSEASFLLGETPIKTLIKIELPLLKTAMLSAFTLVFIDTLKELPLTLLLKPYQLQTLAVKTYEYADDERVAEAALPALLLITIVGLFMIIVNRIQVRQENHQEI